MTTAICFKCGSHKFGALNSCQSCRAMPISDDDIVYSIALSDHYFDLATLEDIGKRLASGRSVDLDPESYETIRKGLIESRSTDASVKSILSSFFGKKLKRKPEGEKKHVDTPILPPQIKTWKVIRENISDRTFRLQGTRRYVDVEDQQLIAILVSAKSKGWDGGDDFFMISGSDGFLRRITPGTVVSREDAKGLGINYYDYIHEQDDAYWDGDNNSKNSNLLFSEDLLRLCLEGGFQILDVSSEINVSNAKIDQQVYLLNYRDHYQNILGDDTSPPVLAELFLFRGWTAQFGYRIFSTNQEASEKLIGETVNSSKYLGLALFEKVHGFSVERELGSDFISLIEDRWQHYDIIVSTLPQVDRLPTTEIINVLMQRIGVTDPRVTFKLARDFLTQLDLIKRTATEIGLLD